MKSRERTITRRAEHTIHRANNHPRSYPPVHGERSSKWDSLGFWDLINQVTTKLIAIMLLCYYTIYASRAILRMKWYCERSDTAFPERFVVRRIYGKTTLGLRKMSSASRFSNSSQNLVYSIEIVHTMTMDRYRTALFLPFDADSCLEELG